MWPSQNLVTLAIACVSMHLHLMCLYVTAGGLRKPYDNIDLPFSGLTKFQKKLDPPTGLLTMCYRNIPMSADFLMV
jgi:hypothetical protein